MPSRRPDNASVSVASCPVSNCKLACGIAPLKAMMDAGVNVGIGTDGSCSNNSLDMCVIFHRYCAVIFTSSACLESSKPHPSFKSCAPMTLPPWTLIRCPVLVHARSSTHRFRCTAHASCNMMLRPTAAPAPHPPLTPFQIVRCATLNGAQAVKVNAGAVEVGRLADLIAIDCRCDDDGGGGSGYNNDSCLSRAAVLLRFLSSTPRPTSRSRAAGTLSLM